MSNNPIADERAYWHAQLGIVDDGSLSLGELRNRTAGAVHVNKAASVGDTSGLSYLTQAQGDARYSQLANAIPLSSSTPLVAQKNGVVGTEAAASHGDHVHPLGPVKPSFYYKTGFWVSPRKTQGTTQFNTLNSAYFEPYPLFPRDWRNVVINQVGVRCTTLQAASNVRVGIWRSTITGEPDLAFGPIFEVNIATTTTGDLAATPAGGNQTLAPGLYWIGVVQQGAVATLDAADNLYGIPPMWQNDTGGMQQPKNVLKTGVTGLLSTVTAFSNAGNESIANVFLWLV